MEDELRKWTDTFAAEGARRFAGWNAAKFRGWCEGPVRRLWTALGEQALDEQAAAGAADDRRTTVREFAQLVAEGIGRGYLGDVGRPRTFLQGLVSRRLPEWIPGIDAGRRAALLAEVWNLGEGVSREAAWLDVYLAARLESITSPDDLSARVCELIEPVLAPSAPVNWSGPFAVRTFDTRAIDDEFLPGRMRLVAPTLVCVSDRRREVNFGLLLERGGAGISVGPLANVSLDEAGGGDPLEATSRHPEPAWEPGSVTLNEHQVLLPFLRQPLEHVFAAGGFLVVNTANSQRLWIVETTG